MVKYLSDHDAYQSFLVDGHLASRSNTGDARSKTDDARNSVGGNKAHTTSEYPSSFSGGTVRVRAQRLIATSKAENVRRKPGIAAIVGEVCTWSNQVKIVLSVAIFHVTKSLVDLKDG